MFKSTLFILILLGSLPLAVSASATTVLFDEEQGMVDSRIYYYEDSLKIIPYAPLAQIVQSDDGLGVNDPYINRDEGMHLSFASEVYNLKLTFADWDPQKDSIVASFVSFCFTNCPDNSPIVDDKGVLQFSTVITELFLFSPSSADETATSLSSASWDDGSPSVVPLPAALPLYAAGMGLMGLMGWRKRRKSAA